MVQSIFEIPLVANVYPQKIFEPLFLRYACLTSSIKRIDEYLLRRVPRVLLQSPRDVVLCSHWCPSGLKSSRPEQLLRAGVRSPLQPSRGHVASSSRLGRPRMAYRLAAGLPLKAGIPKTAVSAKKTTFYSPNRSIIFCRNPDNPLRRIAPSREDRRRHVAHALVSVSPQRAPFLFSTDLF